MANLQGRITQQEAVVSVELESPIYSYGEKIEVIHFRSLNGKCLKKLEARSLKEPGATYSFDCLLLAELSGIPENDIEGMDPEDVGKCKEAVLDFFGRKPKTLESYNQAIMAGVLAQALASQLGSQLKA